MAQGLIKTKSSSTSTTTTPRSSNTTRNGVTKKGALKFNPRKSNLIKAAKINKKFTAGLTAQTEKMLGEKVGHLEMLGGKNHGRKKKQNEIEKKKKQGGNNNNGSSKGESGLVCGNGKMTEGFTYRGGYAAGYHPTPAAAATAAAAAGHGTSRKCSLKIRFM